MNRINKIVWISVVLFAFAFNVYSVPLANQTYYDDCDWKAGQPDYTYCSQDWFLFVFIPLACENICEEQTICLGLFPGSTEDQVFELSEAEACCEFIVTGQLGWSFDASGVVNLGSPVTVDFGWSDSELSEGPFTEIPENLGGPGVTFELNTNLGGNLGAHFFQLCANTITIPGGFNGDATVTTVMEFIYTTF